MYSLKKVIRFILSFTIIFTLILQNSIFVFAAPVEVASPSCIVMEASTGKVIYENNADEVRSPASITKIMTLLLIFEQLDAGKIKLTDEVTTSAHAKSMGGSQVFLEEGEVQTVETLIKCIAVASGNDASVAMAEKISGSEAEFVARMNQKAKELKMEHTNFEDCCGLTDSDAHHTTARDVALMSQELITKYPQVYQYTKIWMEDITHVTNKGSETFTLASTNKLLKQYEYTTGLKTGSTSKAKYCFAATANHNGIDLIAVVMGAPDYKIRFQDAKVLLEYGFHVSHLYQDENQEKLDNLLVEQSIEKEVPVTYASDFRYLDTDGNDLDKIEKKIELPKTVTAPIKKGEQAGEAVYYLNQKKIGSISIIYTESVEKAVWKDYFALVLRSMLL